MRTVDIAPDVRDVLAAATFAGTTLRLPTQLDRSLYERVNKTLVALGAKWERRAGGHVFPGDTVLSFVSMMKTGKVPPRNALAFYPTPQPVVHQMIALARLHELTADRMPFILEPSAGDGAIALEIAEILPDAQIHCVEYDASRAALLRLDSRLEVWEADFLTWLPAAAYDRVLMNPPFRSEDDPTAWLTHVRRALPLLAPDGVLVSVVPTGYLHRVDKKHESFRNLMRSALTTTPLDEGTFEDAGTSANTVLLTIDASALKGT